MILDIDKSADLDGMRVLQSVQLQGDDEHVAAELLPHLELGMDPIVIVIFRVVDPKWFVSDPTPDPDPTFKEVSAPDGSRVESGYAGSTSRKLRGNYANVFVT